MNREILEAIKMIEREKGISAETLILALEDALLAAYKKTPEAVDYARVVIDREEGDMRVLQLVLDEGEEPRTLPQVEQKPRRAVAEALYQRGRPEMSMPFAGIPHPPE